MIILFKYCASMKNCESFRCLSYIYIYIDNQLTVLRPSLSLILLTISLHHLKLEDLSTTESPWLLSKAATAGHRQPLSWSLLGFLFSLKSSLGPQGLKPETHELCNHRKHTSDVVAANLPPPPPPLFLYLFFSFPIIYLFSSPRLILCGFRDWICFGCQDMMVLVGFQTWRFWVWSFVDL